MTTTETKLIAGQVYDVMSLRLIGWTVGSGSGHDGYNWLDYFSATGIYAGADEYGIEPICEAREFAEQFAAERGLPLAR